MSTRATLSIRDGSDVFDIYRHHDGYPEGEHGVIADLVRARALSWDTPQFQAGEFAAAVVATMKTTPGSIYLTRDADLHADRDFHYDLMHGRVAVGIQVKEFSSRTGKVIVKFQGTLPEAAIEFGVAGENVEDDRSNADILGSEPKTRADLIRLPGFSDLMTDTSGNPNVWQNFYDCGCGCSWDVTWSCQVDDECSRCDDTCSPNESFWIGPSEHRELWEALPEVGASGYDDQ